MKTYSFYDLRELAETGEIKRIISVLSLDRGDYFESGGVIYCVDSPFNPITGLRTTCGKYFVLHNELVYKVIK